MLIVPVPPHKPAGHVILASWGWLMGVYDSERIKNTFYGRDGNDDSDVARRV